MSDRQSEIDRNFEAFERLLPALMQSDPGRYVVFRSAEIIGKFDTLADAKTAGDIAFPDGIYSIQKVENTAADLGFFSHVFDLHAAQ